jgi:hypothetical protein
MWAIKIVIIRVTAKQKVKARIRGKDSPIDSSAINYFN